ncbi:MAG TPA: sigma-54 dependent transcriptional regulator [Bacteroidales bacterium]|jgi:transcriptional regulator with PAS, ATPase and Fis domain|nr:sigma-54 dependent transcriptional regulator [Bacteroidales bacterium]HPK30271.1 sigma-54 dependent transcriptional regulator [Bacteroidales bacterium]
MDLRQIKDKYQIIGKDPRLDRAIEAAVNVASTDLSVIVTGESGVGKEFIPRIIHDHSPRKHKRYIAVNCGAIPEGTIDSELFGHEKGAFTGAVDSRKGYFEEADGGTIFLDEVAELPVGTQVRLLRVLQNGEFIRVGSSKVQKTDVRVIAATNIHLDRAVAAGKFRRDLYYRLNTVPIVMPALRERKADIRMLFRKFASDFADRYTMQPVRLDDEAMQLLENYPWPGNIRQLKSVTERISIMETDRLITAEKLSAYLPKDHSSQMPVHTGSFFDSCSDPYREFLIQLYAQYQQLRMDVDELVRIVKGSAPTQQVQQAPTINHTHMLTEGSEVRVPGPVIEVEEVENLNEQEEGTPLTLDQITGRAIAEALHRNANNREKAAAELGISARTIYRKIKEFNLE